MYALVYAFLLLHSTTLQPTLVNQLQNSPLKLHLVLFSTDVHPHPQIPTKGDYTYDSFVHMAASGKCCGCGHALEFESRPGPTTHPH